MACSNGMIAYAAKLGEGSTSAPNAQCQLPSPCKLASLLTHRYMQQDRPNPWCC